MKAHKLSYNPGFPSTIDYHEYSTDKIENKALQKRSSLSLSVMTVGDTYKIY